MSERLLEDARQEACADVRAGKRRRLGLANRALLTTVLIVFVILSTHLGLEFHESLDQGRELLRERGTLLADVQADTLAAALWDFNDIQVNAAMKALRRDPDFRAAKIINADGKTTHDHRESARDESELHISRPITFASHDGTRFLGMLVLHLSAKRVDAEIRAAMLRHIGVAAAVLATVWLVIFVNFARIARPLDMIAHVVGRLARQEHDVVVPALDRSDEVGDIARALAYFRDELAQYEQLRLERERVATQDRLRVRAAVDSASDAILITDDQGRPIYSNPALRQLIGHDALDFGTAQDLAALLVRPLTRLRMLASVRRKGSWNAEAQVRAIDGRVATLLMRVNAIEGDSATALGYVLIATDSTARREAELKLAHLAHHDPLTGLPNRVLFAQRLDEALRACRDGETAVALLVLDLDGFKQVNDMLGHAAGDELLSLIAERLARSIRSGDLVARLGGDEFAIVASGAIDTERLEQLAESVISTVAAPLRVNGRTLYPGTSIGIAVGPEDGQDAELLFRRADMALYAAKLERRGSVRFFRVAMEEEAQARSGLETALRQAVGTSQLSLAYQPLIDASSGATVGAEALMRWRHPVDGSVPPATFIPIAEIAGLTPALGTWALDEACREIARHQVRHSRSLRVAVNLSPAQVSDGLVPLVKEKLEAHGIDPQLLELEITEGTLLRDSDANLEILRRLRELGVGIALDDFGTGYSSLSYLRHFPVTKIKIDRSFIAELGSSPDALAIVRHIIQLGHSLKMRVVAEGVEDETQYERLRRIGCDELQGFLISRPLPPDELARFIDGQRLPSYTA